SREAGCVLDPALPSRSRPPKGGFFVFYPFFSRNPLERWVIGPTWRRCTDSSVNSRIKRRLPMSAHQEYGQDNQAKPADAGQDIQNEQQTQEQAAAQDAQGGESLDAVSALQARLQELEAQQAEFQDHMLRAKAEAENARRRAQEDVAKARKFGIESFAESLVPVKDSLEAALSQPDQDARAWQAGVEATLRQLVTAF